MDRVKDKVAIVTGAALGLGYATAKRLAEEGAKVAVTDVLDDAGQKAVRDIHANVEYWHMDVSKEADVRRVFAEVFKKWGRLDILVNNAGISGANKPTDRSEEQEWDSLMAVNVKGVFFC